MLRAWIVALATTTAAASALAQTPADYQRYTPTRDPVRVGSFSSPEGRYRFRENTSAIIYLWFNVRSCERIPVGERYTIGYQEFVSARDGRISNPVTCTVQMLQTVSNCDQCAPSTTVFRNVNFARFSSQISGQQYWFAGWTHVYARWRMFVHPSRASVQYSNPTDPTTVVYDTPLTRNQ